MKLGSLQIRWIDQIVSDTKGVSDFYSDLFGFEQEAVDEGNGLTSYCLNDKEGESVFGIVEERVFKDWPHGWVLYFEVPDDEYDSYCARAGEMGAEIIRKSPMQCLMKDPAGAPIVINPKKFIGEVES
ncbi:glyoxalase/bleomycin resistance protein [Haloferula helveola]|uniref:Glyoxalase/bleomycin resistance protein n=1 Tax=Haloferula helveola TaxID=490095 RepID=A0ABM7RD40_9BACT|nr:glyoxalase/bleomycin resistance protein [Haloferula helveola]